MTEPRSFVGWKAARLAEKAADKLAPKLAPLDLSGSPTRSNQPVYSKKTPAAASVLPPGALRDPSTYTLEDLFTLALDGRQPSAPQVALCRLVEGRPLNGCLTEELARAVFGCGLDALARMARPDLVCLVAGVRGGKSKLVACAAVWSALQVDCSVATPEEEIWFAVVAPRGRTARATYAQVLGLVRRPELEGLVEGKPTAEEIKLRRPDGRLVSIVVTAASSGGVTVRARWLAGLCLDEVAQFGLESAGAAVNAEEMLGAAETRILDGGASWLASSPYGPQGLLHSTWSRHFGKPGVALEADEDAATDGYSVLVLHAPTRTLNPAFPAKKIAALRARDPDRAAREYDAAWTDPEAAWFPSAWVDLARRTEPATRPREDGVSYYAAMDPATRGNAWTLVVAGRRYDTARQRSVLAIVVAREWIGSRTAPLDPKAVLTEQRDLLSAYGVSMVETDQWSSDALRSIASDLGLHVVERAIGADRFDLYDSLRTKLGAGDVELPPDEQVRSDLLGVRRRLTAGGVAIHLPKTADGRHCDYAPAIVLVVAKYHPEPMQSLPVSGSAEYYEREEAEMLKEELESQQKEKPWRRGLR